MFSILTALLYMVKGHVYWIVTGSIVAVQLAPEVILETLYLAVEMKPEMKHCCAS